MAGLKAVWDKVNVMAYPGEENDIIAYAFNVSREAFAAAHAPPEHQKHSANCCRGAILGLKKINKGKPTAKDISLIEKIMADNEAGRITDRTATISLKKIALKYGVPTYEHDMVLRDIQMQKGLKKQSHGAPGMDSYVPAILLPGAKGKRSKTRRGPAQKGIKIEPIKLKPIKPYPVDEIAKHVERRPPRGKRQLDPLAFIFGPPRKMRKRGRL